MEIYYSEGPRYVDGLNIDLDSNSGPVHVIAEIDINDPVTGIAGLGYEPGQKNKDGSNL